MKNRKHSILSREGFSIIEAMLALTILAAIFALSVGAFVHVLRTTIPGSSQAHFIDMSRIAEQQISDYIHCGKAIGVDTNCIYVMTTNFAMYRILFEDQDGNPDTVEDNVLKYDPDPFTYDDEETICNYVSPLQGEDMFSILSLSPAAVAVAFHLGDGSAEEYTTDGGTGRGYQGLEVRFSATPRNLQLWYDE